MSSQFAQRREGWGQAAMVGAQPDQVPDGLFWRLVPPAGRLLSGPVVVRDHLVDEYEYLGIDNGISASRPGQPWQITPEQPLLLSVAEKPDWMTGWVDLAAEGRLRVAVIAEETAPNGVPIELTARDEPPYRLAGSDITRVLVTGEGEVQRVVARRIVRWASRRGRILDVADLDPEAAAALGDGYLPGAASEPAVDRVARCAPLAAQPYLARSPWPGWQPGDEVDRVADLVRTRDQIIDWLAKAGTGLLAGRPNPDLVQDVGGGQALRYPVLSALGIAATDPGVARWLARQGMTAERGESWDGDHPAMVVAMAPIIALRTLLLPVQTDREVEELYESAAPGVLARLREVADRIPVPRIGLGGNQIRRRWTVDLVQIAMPLVPDCPPALALPPQPVVADTAIWAAGDGSAPDGEAAPDRAWEATIRLPGTAHHGQVSFERLGLQPGEPERETMHDHEPDSPMAHPLIAAWPAPTGAPTPRDATLRGRVPLGAAEAAPVRWRLRFGDWMGRWSDAGEVTVTPPGTPPPPTPTVRGTLVRGPLAPGVAPASSGLIHYEVTMPIGAVLGGLPVAGVHLEVDGVAIALTRGVPTAHSVPWTADVAAPATVPGEQRTVSAQAWSTDSAGTTSSTPHPGCRVPCHDPRPVPAPTVSPRLVATSRPGPDPEAAVRVAVRLPGAGYCRFHTAPEAVVRSTLGLSGSGFRTLPRAQRAAQLLAAGNPPAQGFTELAVVEVGPDGWARATLTVPSATSDLIVLRAVPVTATVDAYGAKAHGAQTPIETVPPTYLVVPSDEVPPLPRVTATVLGPGRLQITIRVSGVDPGTAGRLPGSLQARLVEAVEGTDPHYWPEITAVDLEPDGTGTHLAELNLGVPPWSRLRLAAAVRFAAEATTVPGADLIDDPDLVTALAQGDLIAAPWGPLAAPVPVEVPGTEPDLSSEVDQTAVTITVDQAPDPAAGSLPFAALIYREGPDGALLESAAEEQTVSVGAESFVLPAGPGAMSVVLRDPFGRTREAVPILGG